MRGDGLDQRQEGQVEEQHLVFGVVGDVGDLFRMQAGIDRVQDRAGAGHRVIQFHVAVAVPRQRGNALAHLDAESLQSMGGAPRAPVAVGIGVPVDVAFDPARNDLDVAVMACGKFDNAGDEQGLVHHLPHHWTCWVRRHRHSCGFCGNGSLSFVRPCYFSQCISMLRRTTPALNRRSQPAKIRLPVVTVICLPRARA